MTPAKGLEFVKQNIDIAFYIGGKAMEALEAAVKEPADVKEPESEPVKEPAPEKATAKPKATTKSK